MYVGTNWTNIDNLHVRKSFDGGAVLSVRVETHIMA